MEHHLTGTECLLPYGITQCYLTPDTSEHTPPSPRPIAKPYSMLTMAMPHVKICTVLIYSPDGTNVYGSRGGKCEGMGLMKGIESCKIMFLGWGGALPIHFSPDGTDFCGSRGGSCEGIG